MAVPFVSFGARCCAWSLTVSRRETCRMARFLLTSTPPHSGTNKACRPRFPARSLPHSARLRRPLRSGCSSRNYHARYCILFRPNTSQYQLNHMKGEEEGVGAVLTANPRVNTPATFLVQIRPDTSRHQLNHMEGKGGEERNIYCCLHVFAFCLRAVVRGGGGEGFD